MKILELTNYTAGGCGVGARVLREAKLLSDKGHKVLVFSTNFEKGTNKICPSNEKMGNVEIKRFPAIKLGGDSFMNWSFTKEAIRFNPDVIIAHSYRHTHTTKALKLAKKLKSKVFLVTHAPFARNSSRNLISKIAVAFYDSFIGNSTLKKFEKVIAITDWEIPYLEKLGLNKKNISYSPNGVDESFFHPFKNIKSNKNLNILYIGRISPIKQIETLIEASSILGIKIQIFGPAEKNYLKSLTDLIKRLGSKAEITNKTYNLSTQIKILDGYDLFVLPSKSEGMPQTLLEAMARGKLVVASDSPATRDLINPGKNGFLYKNGSSRDLAKIISEISNTNLSNLNKMQKEARKTAEKFKWKKIILLLEKLISKDTK